jgi:hypothetical protein
LVTAGSVAKTKPLPRPYFCKDGSFVGSLEEVYRTTPTREHLLNVIRDRIRAGEECGGDVPETCAMLVWENRCLHEVVWLLEEMEVKA